MLKVYNLVEVMNCEIQKDKVEREVLYVNKGRVSISMKGYHNSELDLLLWILC